MAETSKATANRLDVARTVITAIREQGPDIAGDLEAMLFPDGPPEVLTVGIFVQAMGDAMARICDELSERDVALAVELADDDPARAKRDRAQQALLTTLASVRALVEGAFGEPATHAVGLPSAMPQDPDELVQQARAAADLLDKTDLGETPRGVTFGPAANAERLRDAADALDESLDSVDREARQAQSARAARDESNTEWQYRYSGLTDAFTGFAFAVRALPVANRVRPTARRRAGLPEAEDLLEPNVGPPTGADPAGGDPTGEPTAV